MNHIKKFKIGENFKIQIPVCLLIWHSLSVGVNMLKMGSFKVQILLIPGSILTSMLLCYL